MDKSAIKSFATGARRRLMEDVRQKVHFYGVLGQDKILPAVEIEGGIEIQEPKGSRRIDNHRWMGNLYKQREKLIKEIALKGYEQVIEEVAYTWFNRIIAIRFMEVNGYLPLKVRVLSSETAGKTEPDLLTQIYDFADDLGLDKQLVFQMKEAHQDDELFKYAFVHQCNQLGQILPRLFEKIQDHTELLLPDQLLATGSVIRELVETIDEEDYQDQVEIIGWMYQYYISERKDEVFDGLKNSKKVTKETLPAATQLFTPKWIVSYMVENTLGRLWQESHPNEELKAQWQYYLQEREQTSEILNEREALINKGIKPEDITFFDPAMGSGHILVYAFDVLFSIYKQLGYMERDIPKLILENNLFGLDIDDRAGQLAYFALMMKGRSKSPTFFKQHVEPQVYAIQESAGISKAAVEFFADPNATKLESSVQRSQVENLVDLFADGKVFGSILTVNEMDFNAISDRIREVEDGIGMDLEGLQYKDEIMSLLPLVQQAQVMSRKYDVVTTNPPYMGNSKLNDRLKSYFATNFSDVKSDFFSVFIERNYQYAKPNGHLGFMTPFVWMFISSYEKLREKMISQKAITSLIQLEYSGFEEATVPICTFTVRNHATGESGEYIKLSDFKGADNQPIKTLEAVRKPDSCYRYSAYSKNFLKIPGSPIAYWASEQLLTKFGSLNVGHYLTTREGMATADNGRFIRFWYEVSHKKIGYGIKCNEEALQKGYKWFPYNKGGNYRKWHGNNDYVVNWENDGYEIRNNFDLSTGRLRSHNFNGEFSFREGLTWSYLSSSSISVRYSPPGFLFDNKGAMGFLSDNTSSILYILAIINSCVGSKYLEIFSPTMDFKVGDLILIPYIEESKDDVVMYSEQCIDICKRDWSMNETSWEFMSSPLIQISKGISVEQDVLDVMNYHITLTNELIKTEKQIDETMKATYRITDNNEFSSRCSIYAKTELEIVKDYISYIVGCMFGRYSLDDDGIICAGNDFDMNRYRRYSPVENNAILILDEEYFESNIVEYLIRFLRTTYSEQTLNDNLKYISKVLKPESNESPRSVLRSYFVKDFYKDHLKRYNGKPIYWLMDSGKQNGFKALFYLHRYEKDTVAMIRTEHLHELQKRYDAHLELLKNGQDQSAKVKKLITDIQKKLDELIAYDKVVAHIAHLQIELDLDDGVDKNYEKFQNIEIPQGEGMKPLKANLLAKR